MKYLNLGCGSRYHADWTNLDFTSTSNNVIAHNLLDGIPFPNNHFDVVYNSHVLEHFSKEAGVKFIKECFRVLAVDGIIRIVVPDLEQLALEYLKSLNDVLNISNELNKANYEWSTIEFLDQMVREQPGGEMLKFWEKDTIINEEKIINRVGHEYLKIRDYIVKNKTLKNNKTTNQKGLKAKLKFYILKKMNISLDNLEIGNFRNGGEIHKWMYDKYSLTNLLTEIGFRNITIQNANSSKISDWDKYNSLDLEGELTRKPDSIFIEAVK